ncbi:MAG TPA: entericidin A/B family lipoprotein [Rhodocyclaceae bacterium]|nr:entericidin A/B family lipoprotein [Rhodocyclaceae bacterium]
MQKKILTVLAALTAVLALGACNTVQGIGKDIEKGGEALQRAANK